MREDEVQTSQPSTSQNPKNIQPTVNAPEQNEEVNDEQPKQGTSEEPYFDGYHEFGYDSDVPFAPWRRRRYSFSIEGLHEEIIDLYHWIRPNELETRIRRKVFEKVYDTIAKRWKDRNVTISMFGSLRTNLFLPSSDIDVLIECPDWDYDVPANLPADEAKAIREDICSYWLEETAKCLHPVGIEKQVSVLTGAFVPIVKMVDLNSRLSIDISFNTVQGVRAADYIEKVKSEFPIIEPLVLILKQFLHFRRLNQTFTGGLSSYGLILLLVNFFQMYAMPMRGKQIYDKGVNLGELLMRFLEVYSQEFNFENLGISVTKMRYIPKDGPTLRGVATRAQTGTLYLEDPLLSCNDVGRSTYNFSVIANAFGQALQILLVAVTVRDRRRSVAWHKVYRGSLLYLITPFTIHEINYRNWLTGGVMDFRQKQKIHNLSYVSNTLIAPTRDLTPFEWMRRVPLSRQKKPASITTPSAGQQEEIVEQTAEEARESQLEETRRKFKEAVEDKKNEEDDDEMTPPPVITSTASVTTTVSTAASISEREDTDSPVLSNDVVTSSDDEYGVATQNHAVQFKKPFSEVVAASAGLSNDTKKGYTSQKNNYIERPYNESTFYGVPNGYAAAVNGNGNRYRSFNYNRDKRTSRNHSQGSNDGSVSEYQQNNKRYSNNSRGRGRTSSHSSNRSRNSSDSRSTGYNKNNRPKENGNIIVANDNVTPATNNKEVTVNATINGRNPGLFRYADAVKMTSNGNAPNRVVTAAATVVATTTTTTNGNNIIANSKPLKNGSISDIIDDNNKTSMNSPTINDINPQLLVSVNNRR